MSKHFGKPTCPAGQVQREGEREEGCPVGFGTQLGAGVLRHDHMEAEVGHLAAVWLTHTAVVRLWCSPSTR